MARVHFESGIVHELYERRIYKRTLPSESFIEKPCVFSELPTELEALRESPEVTVKTETVGRVKILSNWISEINSLMFLINGTALWKNSVLQSKAFG